MKVFSLIINKLRLYSHRISFYLKVCILFFIRNKIVLLDLPEHSNLGDHAISVAERLLLNKIYPNKRIFCFSHSDCSYNIRAISNSIKKSDIVFIHGGGFIGTLWPKEHNVFVKCLNILKDRKTIVFPQTVFFATNDSPQIMEMVDVIRECHDLTILLRDKKSYDFLLSLDLHCVLHYTPDVVLTLEGKPSSPKSDGKVLLCLRGDREKITNTDSITHILNTNQLNYDILDTIAPHDISINNSFSEVKKIIDTYSNYDLVICDRLHSMIFATLAGTPCIALDNISHKVSGVYEWLKDIPQINMINESDLSADLIHTTINLGHFNYDNSKAWTIISNIIKGL